jgi:micrococcal nuclease
MYEYQAKVTRVVDGDTIEAEVDLGFHIKMNMKIRLAGINAPEMNTVEGRKLKAELITLLEDKTVTLLTVKDKQEKYGRYLGIIVKDKQNINEWLVEQKMAVRYNV